jgi:hypothetical protein
LGPSRCRTSAGRAVRADRLLDQGHQIAGQFGGLGDRVAGLGGRDVAGDGDDADRLAQRHGAGVVHRVGPPVELGHVVLVGKFVDHLGVVDVADPAVHAVAGVLGLERGAEQAGEVAVAHRQLGEAGIADVALGGVLFELGHLAEQRGKQPHRASPDNAKRPTRPFPVEGGARCASRPNC